MGHLEQDLAGAIATRDELRTAGEGLASIAARVINNATLDSGDDPTWFDDRDAALAAWSALLARYAEVNADAL